MDKNYFIDEYLKGMHPIEEDSWELPTDEELDRDEALFDALLAERTVPKRRALYRWLYPIPAVAAGIALLIAFDHNDKVVPVEEKPVVAEVIEKPAPEPSEPIKPSIPIKPIKPDKPQKPQAEPKQQEEEAPVIPPDKQALADIYLAEEALQVALGMQAQQEAIRAYTASLTDEEPDKPIIAL